MAKQSTCLKTYEIVYDGKVLFETIACNEYKALREFRLVMRNTWYSLITNKINCRIKHEG